MNHISSYPSVFALGHKWLNELLLDPVVVEEKIDGSQFSMCRKDGELSCRSKGKDLIIDAPEKMFAQAIETAKSMDLRDGWVYRCEYLQKPKHNTLAYSRIPNKHLMVFDILTGPEQYLTPFAKRVETERIGLEVVPFMREGVLDSLDKITDYLDRESILGGVKIEGVVVKNYQRFGQDKKILVGKYVSEAFKEKHVGEWKKSNPTAQDVVQQLISELRTEARWHKAIQHLRDNSGVLENSPRDIGVLIKEIQDDVRKEEHDHIKDRLFWHFWPQIHRAVVGGFPEFYKKHLAEHAFTQN